MFLFLENVIPTQRCNPRDVLEFITEFNAKSFLVDANILVVFKPCRNPISFKVLEKGFEISSNT